MKIKRLALFDSTELPLNDKSSEKNKISEIPDEILIARFGNNNFTKDGKRGEFDFSERDAENVISEFKSRGKDIVIDYEHQTVKGVKAPAAGWIESLTISKEGLLGKVRYWTEQALAHLKKGEYRYISPVLYFSRREKSVSALHSIALTNHPAMHNYPALVADDSAVDEDSIDIKDNMKGRKMNKLLEMLGLITLADSSGEEQSEGVMGAVSELLEARDNLEDVLKLYDCSSTEELKSKLENMVPAEEKSVLEEAVRNYKSESLVNKAFSDGKLAQSSLEWAMDFARKDLQGFNDWAAGAPVIVPDNKNISQANPAQDIETLTDAENKIYHLLGLTDSKAN